MFKRLQGFLLGCLVCSLLTCTVYAKTGTSTIQAIYNNIKIYVDGVKINPTDANGKQVEPFIYNGTTYLPVRAVGQALGKQVSWDGTTHSVYIGQKPASTSYLLDVCAPYKIYCGSTHLSKNAQSFKMSGKTYTNGLSFGGYFYADDKPHALFNLSGKYSTLSCTIGYLDGSTVDALDDSKRCTVYFVVDDRTVKTVDASINNLPKEISVPLNYGNQLKIMISNFKSRVGIGNITVK